MPDLLPVDHDPFATALPDLGGTITLKPVDHDPFADVGKPRLNPDDLLTRGPGVYQRGDDPVRELSTQRHNPINAGELAIGLVGGPRLMPRAPGIRAYHGSPHDFEKFESSKIGTGEGTQAYGHGLYFAENEGVARSYREQLAGIAVPKTPAQEALMAVEKFGSPEAALKWATDKYSAHNYASFAPQHLEAFKRGLNEVFAGKVQIERPGKMYEVNINAKPEQFLDWDKPIGAQTEHVARAIGKYDFDKSRTAGSIVVERGRGPEMGAELSEAGIPGIRYLDQGSRNVLTAKDFEVGQPYRYDSRGVFEKANKEWYATSKTRGANYKQYGPFKTEQEAAAHIAAEPWKSSNYVIFDPGIVDIIRKYGLAGLSALPPATAAFLSDRLKPVDHDPFADKM